MPGYEGIRAGVLEPGYEGISDGVRENYIRICYVIDCDVIVEG